MRTREDELLERADEFVQSWKDSALMWRCGRCGTPSIDPKVVAGVFMCHKCGWPRKEGR